MEEDNQDKDLISFAEMQQEREELENQQNLKIDHEIKKENPVQIFHGKVAAVLAFISVIPLTAWLLIFINGWIFEETSGEIWKINDWIWLLFSFFLYSWALIYTKFVDKLFAEEFIYYTSLAIYVIYLVWMIILGFVLYLILWPLYVLYGLCYLIGYAFNAGRNAQKGA